jgi:hypothetical protein
VGAWVDPAPVCTQSKGSLSDCLRSENLHTALPQSEKGDFLRFICRPFVELLHYIWERRTFCRFASLAAG